MSDGIIRQPGNAATHHTTTIKSEEQDHVLDKSQVKIKDEESTEMPSSPQACVMGVHYSHHHIPVTPYEEECPICSSAYASTDQAPGRLACSHRFHVDCLLDWAQVSTSCPYCRAEFSQIQVLASSDAEAAISRTILVEARTQVVNDEVEDVEEDAIYTHFTAPQERMRREPSRPTRCIMCGTSGFPEVLMLCDLCNDAYHTFCLDDEPTMGPFYCPTCHVARADEVAAQPTRSRHVRMVADMQSPATLRTRRAARQRNLQVQRLARMASARLPDAMTDGARLSEWRRAWRRARHHALEEDVATRPARSEHDALTAAQRHERRLWRSRLDAGRPSSSRPRSGRNAEQRSAEAEEDTALAQLWQEAEQAAIVPTSQANIPAAQATINDEQNLQAPPEVGQSAVVSTSSHTESSGQGPSRQKRPVRRSSEQQPTTSKRRAESGDSDAQPNKRLQQSVPSSPDRYVSMVDAILDNIRRPLSVNLAPLMIARPAQNHQDAWSGAASSPSPPGSISAASTPKGEHSPALSGKVSPVSSSVTERGGYFALSSPSRDSGLVASANQSSSTPRQAVTKRLVSQHVVAILQAHYDVQRINSQQFARINRDVTRAVYSEYAAAMLPEEGVRLMQRRVSELVLSELALLEG